MFFVLALKQDVAFSKSSRVNTMHKIHLLILGSLDFEEDIEERSRDNVPFKRSPFLVAHFELCCLHVNILHIAVLGLRSVCTFDKTRM